MVTPTGHVIAGPDLHRAGLLEVWRFSQHFFFLPNIGEGQKKSYDLSAGPLAGTASYCGKSGMANVLRSVHNKARCGPEIATFRTKTLNFFRVMRLNWQATIELRGSQSP